MKKFKKLFAVILSLAMVLGMSVTVSAATKNSATITVDGIEATKPGGATATLKYLQIIKADQTTRTGWNFASDDIAKAFQEAFKEKVTTKDSQDIIDALIEARNEKGEANSNEIGLALSKVAAMDGFKDMDNPQTVTEAGVYAIKATQEGFTYNNMAAYVGFGTVNDTMDYPSLEDAELTAKRVPIRLDKSSDDKDKVSGIGDEVTYTITTSVPYIDPLRTNKKYCIHDEITGAEYVLNTDGTVAGTVKKGSLNGKGGETLNVPIVVENGNTFYIDLHDLIDDQNSNAGQEIFVQYKAKITAPKVENKAQAGHKDGSTYGSEYGEDDEDVYTGKITLTKKGEGTTLLANAGFEVTDKDNKVVYFTKDGEGVYTRIKTSDVPTNVKKELDNASDAKKTEKTDLEVTVADEETNTSVTYVRQVFTKTDGTVLVQGLNVGEYKFTEKTAPEGYSVNETASSATLKITDENDQEIDVADAEAKIEASTDMTDTKLSALPSTGGIGTTIFTIGGCLIMIIAAALFFASRRKSAK